MLEQGIAQLETQEEALEEQRNEAASQEKPDEALIAQLDAQIAAVQEQLTQLDAQKNGLQWWKIAAWKKNICG